MKQLIEYRLQVQGVFGILSRWAEEEVRAKYARTNKTNSMAAQLEAAKSLGLKFSRQDKSEALAWAERERKSRLRAKAERKREREEDRSNADRLDHMLNSVRDLSNKIRSLREEETKLSRPRHLTLINGGLLDHMMGLYVNGRA